MNIGSVRSLDIIKETDINRKKESQVQGKVFEDFYHAAMGMIDQTNTLQKQAEQSALDFAMGKTDNIHNLMIAEEKANIALQFTVQVRNKVLEAYKEIMRMPV